MSLNWDISKCDPVVKSDAEWPVTETLIHLTMAAHMGEITEKSWEEFYMRLKIMEKTGGAFFHNGKGEDVLVTKEMVRLRIGLRTNVSTVKRAQFNTHTMRWLREEIQREDRSAEWEKKKEKKEKKDD